MTSTEKAELMKSAIYQMYSNEGRSKSYISRLLQINRKTVSEKIKEWGFKEAEHRHYMSPSRKKFLNKNRELIKSRLDKDATIESIARELKTDRYFLKRIIKDDPVLTKANEDKRKRLQENSVAYKEQYMQKSFHDYDFKDLPNEEWKEILSYQGYFVSNMGRVKHFVKSYKRFYLITQTPNKNNNRLYVCLYKNNKCKNLQVSRLVAHAFVSGYSDEKNTVNHEDGNVLNNKAENLSWVSQSENNKHSYEKLKRPVNKNNRSNFRLIKYQDKYEFKTVTAFAKFIGKSETQTRRYLENPDKHGIKLIS